MTTFDIDKIACQMYEEGNSIDRIAKVLGVTRGSVSSVIRSQLKKTSPAVDERKVKSAIKAGRTVDEIANEMGATRSEVAKVAGVDLAALDWDEVDHEAFTKIDTPEKAYWLGFMYFNGSINRSMTELTVVSKVEGHLDGLRAIICPTGPEVERVEVEALDVELVYYRLNILSDTIPDRLIDHGMMIQPTMDLSPPKKVVKALVSDFVRGMVDSSSGRVNPSTGLLSIETTEPLARWIEKSLPSLTSKRLSNGRVLVHPVSNDKAVEVIDRLYETAPEGAKINYRTVTNE